MTAEQFQKDAHTFSQYPFPFLNESKDVSRELNYIYPALGLAEEAGEVAGKYAKAIRDENGFISLQRKEEIKKELGDVLWFVAELSTQLGLTLSEVMQCNIDKLSSRKARGVISGSGDNR